MNEFYNKLVDLYAGGELTEELEQEHMRVRKDTVKNDGEMREELGYNVKST